MNDKPEQWECYCDEAYYHLWAVRKIGEKRFGHSFHMNSMEEAKGLTEMLNLTPPQDVLRQAYGAGQGLLNIIDGVHDAESLKFHKEKLGEALALLSPYVTRQQENE